MFTQLIEDLVHLEGSGDRLDEHGGLDRTAGHAEGVLGVAEHVIPEPGFMVVLELREVEVRRCSAVEGLTDVVEEDEAEVDETGGRRATIDLHVTLGKMPTAGPDDQGGDLVVDGVALAVATQREVMADGVTNVDLAVEHVVPGWGTRILKVGHEHPRAGVQGINHHLALGRAGDLDATIEQVLGRRGHRPRARPNLGGLGQEVGSQTGVELLLAYASTPKQLDATVSEGSHEVGDEGGGFRREDLVTEFVFADLDAVQVGHESSLLDMFADRRSRHVPLLVRLFP